MKIGASTYSLSKAIKAGAFDVLGAFDWLAQNRGEHIEIVPLEGVFSLVETPGLATAMAAEAKALGIDISCYTFGASFIDCTATAFDAELDRVKRQVDLAARLGARLVRHDIAFRPAGQNGDEQFDRDFAGLVDACGEIADYAARLAITTMIENHGLHVQGAHRVLRLHRAVARSNFRLLVDTGNFYPVEFENTREAIRQCAPYAGMVHVKDHHIRTSAPDPIEGWRDRGRGVFTQPAIAGEGDIGIREALGHLKAAGFDGYLSLEYEGHEEAQFANRQGMGNLRCMLDRQ